MYAQRKPMVSERNEGGSYFPEVEFLENCKEQTCSRVSGAVPFMFKTFSFFKILSL